MTATKYTARTVLSYLQLIEMADVKLPIGIISHEATEAYHDYLNRLLSIRVEVEAELMAEGWKNEETLPELEQIARLA